MRFLRQYGGLRREMYVVFFGRVVTNMGALIWPMLTLILKNKMGMSASEIASLLLLLGCVQLPCMILGGKLADRFPKRNIIIVCDLVTVASYMVCAFLPVSGPMVALMFLAGVFAQMEWPSYDALVADISAPAERERAYSLNYLGANLGIVLAPILGGFLFENHLNLAFAISSAATFSSTVLIFLLIKNTAPAPGEAPGAAYEAGREGQSTWGVLRENRVLLLFLSCQAVWSLVYSQFNFLLPLNMEQLYGAKGAVRFGMLTSVNAVVVIVGTPLITGWFSRRLHDTGRLVWGQLLIAAGFLMYVFIQGAVPLYFLSMAVFTVGEIFGTLGSQPYITRRIPASHRGRVASITSIFSGTFSTISQKGVGALADAWPMRAVWLVVALLGFLNVCGYLVLCRRDKKAFPLLYSEGMPPQTLKG